MVDTALHVLWSAHAAAGAHAPFPSSITDALRGGASAELVSGLAELDEFLHTLFVWRFEPRFFIQMGAVGAFLALLCCLGTAVVVHRLVERKFWLFKLMRKNDGTYIVPNAFNSFLLFEGAFSLVWIALSAVIYECYYKRVDRLQHQIVLLSAAAWIPLILGAAACGLGSFFTAPGVLEGSFATRKNRLWTAAKPWAINGLALGAPILLLVSTLTPAALAQKRVSAAFGMYQAWSAQAAALQLDAAGGSLAPAQIDEALATASAIWDAQAGAMGLLGITYLVWTVWAAVFTLGYTVGAGWLVFALLKQIRNQAKLLRAIEKDNRIEQQKREAEDMQLQMLPKLAGSNHRLASPTGNESAEPGLEEDGSGRGSLLFSPLGTPLDKSFGIGAVSATGQTEKTLKRVSISISPPASPRELFFPPLRDEARRRATRRMSSFDSSTTRFHYMRRCFISLAILYLGVTCGALLYLVITARLGSRMYSAALAGPEAMTRLIYSSHLTAAYGAAVFGFLTIGSIFVRDIDPASAPSASRASRGASLSPATKLASLPSPLQHRPSRIFLDSSKHSGLSVASFAAGTEKAGATLHLATQPAAMSHGCLEAQAPRSPLERKAPPRSSRAMVIFESILARRAQTTSADSDVDYHGVASEPEVPRQEPLQSRMRSRTVVYDTPFGPMPAPARFDDRPLAPERGPPPFARSSTDGHADSEGEGPRPSLKPGRRPVPQLLPVDLLSVQPLPRNRAGSLTSLSGADPSSTDSLALPAGGASTPRKKRSSWISRELARMDNDQGGRPIRPVPRRPSLASSLVASAAANSSCISLDRELPRKRSNADGIEGQGGHELARGDSSGASSAYATPPLSPRLGPITLPSTIAWSASHEHGLSISIARACSSGEDGASESPRTPLTPRQKRRRPRMSSAQSAATLVSPRDPSPAQADAVASGLTRPQSPGTAF